MADQLEAARAEAERLAERIAEIANALHVENDEQGSILRAIAELQAAASVQLDAQIDRERLAELGEINSMTTALRNREPERFFHMGDAAIVGTVIAEHDAATPLSPERLAEIKQLCDRMQSWEEWDDNREDHTCVKCGEVVHLSEPELERSPLCDACAQDVAAAVPELLSEVRRLEFSGIEPDSGILELTVDHIHIRGVYGDGGENESVLSISAVLDASPYYPESGLFVIGSPSASPLIDGDIPNLGCFSCGVVGAERLIRVLQKAVRDAKARLAATPQGQPGAKSGPDDPGSSALMPETPSSALSSQAPKIPCTIPDPVTTRCPFCKAAAVSLRHSSPPGDDGSVETKGTCPGCHRNVTATFRPLAKANA